MLLISSRYLKNIKKASKVFKDRPQKPLDIAVWWVEYVLRHQDTSFLRPLSMSQTWYEKRLLDVWAFIAGVFIVGLWMTFFVFKTLISYCFGKSSKVTPRTEKKSKSKKN